MILVDTSVWIDLLNTAAGKAILPDEIFRFVTCGPILQEVLQGLREAPGAEKLRLALLALPMIGEPVTLATFLHAADIYRNGRNRGYNIRSSTDCLIAAIAIEHKAPVWHRDRDFDHIAAFTNLKTVTALGRR